MPTRSAALITKGDREEPQEGFQSSNPKLRYMREITLPQLLLINVVVDVDSIFPDIASKLLDEFPWHSCAPKVGCKPMAATVWKEVITGVI